MKCVDSTDNDATTETVDGGRGGDGGGKERKPRSKDTSDGTVVADLGKGFPCLPPSLQPPQPQRSLSSSSRAPPRRVDHLYRDYSNFPFGELPIRSKPSTNFPSKLHQILSSPDYSHIITWMPHGRAWKVNNRELLMSEVVPKYFGQSKYESFTRQLNGWGFKRLLQSGNDFNAYYHECFLREMPHLILLMKRAAQNLGKLLPHVEGEPNFYEIAKQFPLPLPAVPHLYPGHCTYSSSHLASADYWPALPEVPEPPYHNRSHHYPPYPSSYPPYPSSYPPPPPYYVGHHGGPPPAVVHYAPPPHPGYSQTYYPPVQGSGQLSAHDHHHQYPCPPYSSLSDVQPFCDKSPPNNAVDTETSDEIPPAPPKASSYQDQFPTDGETALGPLGPKDILRQLDVDSSSIGWEPPSATAVDRSASTED